MMYPFFCMVMVILWTSAHGENLGTFGPTFSIKEKSLLEHIFERLKYLEESGGFQEHNNIITKTVMERLHHPDPVKGLVHTKTPRTYTFDPSIVVSQDLQDHEGRVFYKKGTRLNPLHTRSLTKPLLFIDGDADDHHTWLQKQRERYPHAKVILVKGDPIKGMDQDDRHVFYDQGGHLTSKLGIRQVPAKVTQTGDVLRIDEEISCDTTLQEEIIRTHHDGDLHG